MGRFNLFFNAALFVACWALYDLPTLIYSVLNTIFNAVSMDRAHRQSVTVQVLIFTKKDTQELGRYILENLHPLGGPGRVYRGGHPYPVRVHEQVRD